MRQQKTQPGPGLIKEREIMSVTISGQFIAEKKHIWVGLTSIYGIGKTTAMKICDETKVPSDKKVSD